mgnify:CR=1 FL=1
MTTIKQATTLVVHAAQMRNNAPQPAPPPARRHRVCTYLVSSHATELVEVVVRQTESRTQLR